jgi:acetolactate synthase-1/2/3 large subunit
VGGKRENFAPQAQIIRVDIDENELENKIRSDEKQFKLPLSVAIPILGEMFEKQKGYEDWLLVCQEIKKQIKYTDEKEPNRIVNAISYEIPDNYSVVADVGQNMVWVAQSFRMKKGQRFYLSGGHGAMGYALPAAIGIYYATHRPVVCFCGDGGFQMNIQELQFVAREKLPIKIVILNNLSLGMIRHFQEMYFESNYYYTVEDNGYTVPDFCKIVNAYGIESKRIFGIDEVRSEFWKDNKPYLYEVMLSNDTVVSPKLEFGKPNQDQEPLLDRKLYNYLMEL